METTPLPILDNDLSDNDSTVSDEELSLSHYCVRITSCEKFTKEQIVEFFGKEFNVCKYVIGIETDTEFEHYHLVLSVDSSYDIKWVKDIVRAFIVPLWQTDGKLPVGWGNKQYNCKLSYDVDAAVSYAVKWSEYWYDGWSADYITLRKAQSFIKKKPSNFKSDYLQLCEQFQGSDMDTREFMVKYVQLKAKYGQAVQMHHAYGYALSNLFLRDPSEADNYVESFLYKQ